MSVDMSITMESWSKEYIMHPSNNGVVGSTPMRLVDVYIYLYIYVVFAFVLSL
jgi:hypothetical protein